MRANASRGRKDRACDMTAHKHFKQLVRARMAKTGESYTTARRHILRQAGGSNGEDGPGKWHFPGSVPGSTALRVLLTAAGVRDPRTARPFSEEMLFGIAGGIGMGVASFHYAAGDVSTFFIAGRHLWYDHLAYLRAALERFGIDEPVVRETAGAKGAAKQLREALADGRPCVAWVDGYHVVTVYAIDEARGTALVGDLADEPIEMSLEHLAETRGRIKQYKNRLLSLPPAAKAKVDLDRLIHAGLVACHAGLRKGSGKGAEAMSGLERLEKWAQQLRPSAGKESWQQMFPRGHRLWQGLTSIHDFIEHHRTGGALCRAIFADFLAEAAEIPGWRKLQPLAQRYAEVAKLWTQLAAAAMPPEVAAFRTALELSNRRAELKNAGEVTRACEQMIAEQKEVARREFPLSEAQCTSVLETLHGQASRLHEAESSAHAELGALLR
jgi:hypothetical protein